MIGGISTGTLRQADLLESFADALEALLGKSIKAGESNIEAAQRQLELIADANAVRKVLELGEQIDADADDIADDCEYASDLLVRLSDTLQEYALPFTYFGTHEGDGASFGFYPVDVNEAARDDPSGLEVRSDSLPDHVAVINGHGNVSLYAVTAKLVWDCV